MARPLALALLRAGDWFDTALRDRLAADGWPPLSRSQSLVFASLDPRGTSISRLAGALDVTRQSAHSLVHALAALGLVVLDDDPDDARRRLVVLTELGEALAAAAGEHLAAVEEELAARLGPPVVDGLRAALDEDWGPPPVA